MVYSPCLYAVDIVVYKAYGIVVVIERNVAAYRNVKADRMRVFV